MLSPEIGRIEMRGQQWIIPKLAPRNEHGFVIPPVVPGQVQGKPCRLCGDRTCKPNVHHLWWPGPMTTAQLRRGARRVKKFEGLPQYREDTIEGQLRSAEFSISGPICYGYHTALHNLQDPPRHLPSRRMIKLALHQMEAIDEVVSLSQNVKRKCEAGAMTGLEAAHDELEKWLGEMPDETVFPTYGYRCLVNVDSDDVGTELPKATTINVEGIGRYALKQIKASERLLS